MKQISRIISTYSADTMGVCSALFELGGMTIMHDASGCNSTYTTHDEPRWYDMDSMVYISALTEMEAIMGDDEKILRDIEDAVNEMHPKFVAIAGTPIPTMTGFDFESVAAVAEQRTGVPCFGFPTTGMNTYIHGAGLAFKAIAERFVKDPASNSGTPKTAAAAVSSDSEQNAAASDSVTPRSAAASSESELNAAASDSAASKTAAAASNYKVNILGLTPLDFSVNGQDAAIAAWLESENFEIVSRWAMGSSLDEIAMAGAADVNLVVSASGLPAARVLFERFGTPYAVGLPIGENLAGLLSDMIKIKIEEFRKSDHKSDSNNTNAGSHKADFESREISVHSGVFLGARDSDSGSDPYESGFVAVIGEGVAALSLASAIELERGIPAKVLCATELPDDMLRECDRMTPDEDDIIEELKGAAVVIADPLYKPIVPAEAKFIPLPSEAFSGRLYRAEIPNLISDFEDFSSKMHI